MSDDFAIMQDRPLGGRRLNLILSVVGVIVLWHLGALIAGKGRTNEPLVPTGPELINEFKQLANYWKGGVGVQATKTGGHVTWAGAFLGLGYNVGLTALRMTVGLLLGIGAGAGVAVCVCWSRLLRGLLALPSHFARMLPLLAMVPLFSLWFGDTNEGSVLFIAMTAFVLVFGISVTAIGQVPAYYPDFARSLGASRLRSYATVVLPAALPQVRPGILLAVGFGWSAAIASEYLGQQFGLGAIVQNAQFFCNTKLLGLIAALAITLAIVTYLLVNKLLLWATRWAE
jgi:sulfonate transport system permease protein